jgi:hypothetical protein
MNFDLCSSLSVSSPQVTPFPPKESVPNVAAKFVSDKLTAPESSTTDFLFGPQTRKGPTWVSLGGCGA